MNLYNRKWVIRLSILLGAALIGVVSLIYTKNLVEELKEEERKKVKLWAEATKELSRPDTDNINSINLIFEVIKNNTTVPVILTDQTDTILYHRNLKIPQRDSYEYLQKELLLMKGVNDSIVIDLGHGDKQFLFYKDSILLQKLTWFPLIQLIVVSIFMAFAYWMFSGSRKSEQNKVWVGLAKETAHQLGTPTSSLLGWIDVLRLKECDESIVSELQKDVKRLEKITERFSKIGSLSDFKEVDVNELITTSIHYLKSRLSKQVEFVIRGNEHPLIMSKLNPVLFEWVIENICKNAVDAMAGKGKVTVESARHGNKIVLDIIDTGKGIPKSKFKTVFLPGYTTKKRGWGLGLSLVKRIVEDYHNGKIVVKESEVGKGTTFRITFNA